MMIKKSNKRIITEFAFILTAIVSIVFFGKECSSGALKGIYYCLNVLIPSIFPFMAISVLTAKSAVSRTLGKASRALCRKLFGVSPNLSAVIFMSVIGGYPVGARGIAALRENGAINEADAVKASYFAVGAGPGFLITFVGGKLLSCPQIGVCMLISQVLSVIILGVVNKIVFVKKDNYNSYSELYSKPLPFASAVTEAVTSSAYGMLEMCGMVVVFSAIIGISERLFGNFNLYISVLLEVTTACGLLAEKNNIILIAFAAGFGGLCVHFQIFTALKNIHINKGLFFIFRIIQGIITALLTELFIMVFKISLPVFSSAASPLELSLSSSLIGSALLILCGAGFLYSINTNP